MGNLLSKTCNRPTTKKGLVSCNRNSKKCDYKFRFCNLGVARTINHYEFSITSFTETRNLGARLGVA
jgi:hypothetical protein